MRQITKELNWPTVQMIIPIKLSSCFLCHLHNLEILPSQLLLQEYRAVIPGEESDKAYTSPPPHPHLNFSRSILEEKFIKFKVKL